jgi:hypothetical protein
MFLKSFVRHFKNKILNERGTWGGVAMGVGSIAAAGIGASAAGKAGKGGGIQYPNAKDIYGQAIPWANENFPLQMGAQNSALQQLQTPQSIMQYYQGFQPTSFEQALAGQNFQNIWPNQQAYINNILSKSGMMYSPVAAQTLGNAYGLTATNIGEYLNQQANNRANISLQARLGINPMDYVNSYANTAVGQGNQQANANYAQSMAQLLGQQQAMQQLGSSVGGTLGYYLQNGQQPQVQQDAYMQAMMGNGQGYFGQMGSSNVPGTGLFGTRLGGQTQSEILGFPTAQYSSPVGVKPVY